MKHSTPLPLFKCSICKIPSPAPLCRQCDAWGRWHEAHQQAMAALRDIKRLGGA